MNEYDQYNGLPMSEVIRLANVGLLKEQRRVFMAEARIRAAVERIAAEKATVDTAVKALGDPTERERQLRETRRQEGFRNGRWGS